MKGEWVYLFGVQRLYAAPGGVRIIEDAGNRAAGAGGIRIEIARENRSDSRPESAIKRLNLP